MNGLAVDSQLLEGTAQTGQLLRHGSHQTDNIILALDVGRGRVTVQLVGTQRFAVDWIQLG